MASELTNRVIKWLEDYRDSTRCRGVVLGISGGKDSTTVAMLAKKVWGDNVVGVMMPNGHQADLQDAMEICDTLKIRSSVVNIEEAVQETVNAVEWGHFTGITPKAMTNIPPRIRMTTLYVIAQSMGYRVIGTGNASEAFIGWTTKWGDSAYDLNPIYGLTCGEVVRLGLELAAEFGLNPKFIDKPPADGLTGKSDEDNFGFSYGDLDKVINGETQLDEAVVQRIMKMHEVTEHKRRLPYCFRKEEK